MVRTAFVGIFLGIFFLFSLPCYAVLYFVERVAPKKAQAVSQAIVSKALSIIFFMTGSELTVIGRENIPVDGNVLYIGNHTGYFDIVTTYPLLPAGVGFVAKKELDRFALLRWWMHFLHGLTFDRNDPRSGMHMIMDAIEEIKKGYSVFIYPEGTRSKTGEVGEFKAGSFKVATRTNCPIIPVAISGTGDIFENHVPSIRPTKVKIRFGEPILLDSLSADEKKHIANYVKQKILAMREEM